VTLVWLLAVTLAAEPQPPVSGDHTRTLHIDGRERSYLTHVPPKYDPQKPTPVVLIFHGGGSNAEQMIQFCGLNEKADQEGFIAVFPQGTGRLKRLLTWNGGNCCGYAQSNKVDDVAFTRALLDDLAKVVNVDSSRVYATGMSNGAIMCYLLAAELSDRIAAIAPVAGPMGTETCSPRRPVSVIHFHGTDDQFAPFHGGKGSKSLSQTEFFSVEHSIRAWIKANDCPEKLAITDEPNKADDGMTVQRKSYGPGTDGAEVVLLTINGGGHTWPGREPVLRSLGKSTKDVSANDLMWEFFRKHPLK
jgi:polyhydroxybutyrate depolymerase